MDDLDWKISEINISDVRWWIFDMDKIKEVRPLKMDEVNLGEVEEIGCTDLMRGGSSRACSRLDWIEVYGKPISRD